MHNIINLDLNVNSIEFVNLCPTNYIFLVRFMLNLKILSGYLNNPQATKLTIDGQGWYIQEILDISMNKDNYLL